MKNVFFLILAIIIVFSQNIAAKYWSNLFIDIKTGFFDNH